jgi:hypothetical protein
LTDDKDEDNHVIEEHDCDDTASSQEFLFFTRRKTEENHKTVNNKTQERNKSKSSQRKISTENSVDDSIDPNDEIEKWKKGKPKVGNKRRKKSEASKEKEIGVEVTDDPQHHSPAKKSKGNNSTSRTTEEKEMSADGSYKVADEPQTQQSKGNNSTSRTTEEKETSADGSYEVADEIKSHSPAKQLRGNKSSSKSSRERKTVSDDSQKSQHLESTNSRGNSKAPLTDTNTCDDESLSDIEASELVIEVGKEITQNPKSAGKKKSGNGKDGVEVVSKVLRKSQRATAQRSSEDSNTVDSGEQAASSLHQVDNFPEDQVDSLPEEERDQISDNEKTSRKSTITDQSGESTLKNLKETTNRRRKSPREQTSRKSSAGTSQVSEVEKNEKSTIENSNPNASDHARKLINTFLSEDHERQDVDSFTRSRGSGSKSAGFKTRKAKCRNDSMQRNCDSGQKRGKFRNKTFTGASEVTSSDIKAAKKDVSRLVSPKGRSGRKSTRSLHSLVIGSIKKLQGSTTHLENPEDNSISVEKDVDPDDMYMEKENTTSARSKRKGQKKRSLQQEKGKKRDRSKRSAKKKASEEKGVEDSNLEVGEAEGIQEHSDFIGECNESNVNESGNLLKRKTRSQRNDKSVKVVPNKMSKKKGDNSVNLGSHNELVEAVNDDDDIGIEAGKIGDQDEGKITVYTRL